MNLFICGSELFGDAEQIRAAMENFYYVNGNLPADLRVATRGLLGVDAIVVTWCKRTGVPLSEYILAKREVPSLRDTRALTTFLPAQVLAFDAGPESEDLLAYAKEAGIKIVNVPLAQQHKVV